MNETSIILFFLECISWHFFGSAVRFISFLPRVPVISAVFLSIFFHQPVANWSHPQLFPNLLVFHVFPFTIALSIYWPEATRCFDACFVDFIGSSFLTFTSSVVTDFIFAVFGTLLSFRGNCYLLHKRKSLLKDLGFRNGLGLVWNMLILFASFTILRYLFL